MLSHSQILIMVLLVFVLSMVYRQHQVAKFCLCRAGGGSDSETFQSRNEVHKIVNSCSYPNIYAGVL